MFDPSKYKAYRYHGSMMYIDEKATISDIRDACPMFFENASKGEKRSMHRGHLIVKKLDKYSIGSAWRIVIYAWDIRTKDTHCIDVDVQPCDLREAKKIINDKLDTPEPNPLTYSTCVETMNVPVSVRVTVFRDENGEATNIELTDWLKVGEDEATERKPLDMAQGLFSYVNTAVCRSLAKTKATP